MQKRFVETVEAFLDRSGMSPSSFGKEVANNGKLVARLRGGASVSLTTADRILRFIRAYDRVQRSRAKAAAAREERRRRPDHCA